MPAVVHWKVGHFGALVREVDGRYLLKDPTFGNDTWVTRDALDEEASGGESRRVRIQELTSGTETKNETFVWCGSRICQKRAANGTTVLRSYFGQGFEEAGPPAVSCLYTRDHLGSVREVVANDGTTVASRMSYGQTMTKNQTSCGLATCPGEPSTDFYSSDSCYPADRQGSCMDACVLEGLAGPRPRYPRVGVSWWFGKNCTEFADDILSSCSERCGFSGVATALN